MLDGNYNYKAPSALLPPSFVALLRYAQSDPIPELARHRNTVYKGMVDMVWWGSRSFGQWFFRVAFFGG